ncbi:hypothetical protein K501DRAFT_302952 [Backusella circina FSU 941]|nr:hypothetical protein K501DRAFT_302952 [Backusella circina FSU 941]
MPGISFDSLLFIRNTNNSKNVADPTNSKTHLQSCIRFASRFIKLRSPLKPSTMRQSTSFDIPRHDDDKLSTEKKRMNRAYSSPDFTRLHDEYIPNHHLSDQSVFVYSKKNHLHKRRNSSDIAKLFISDTKSFISQPACKERRLQEDSDDDDEDDEEEMTIKYAKPATAFLVSLSPSAAAAASAARYRRRRQKYSIVKKRLSEYTKIHSKFQKPPIWNKHVFPDHSVKCQKEGLLQK